MGDFFLLLGTIILWADFFFKFKFVNFFVACPSWLDFKLFSQDYMRFYRLWCGFWLFILSWPDHAVTLQIQVSQCLKFQKNCFITLLPLVFCLLTTFVNLIWSNICYVCTNYASTLKFQEGLLQIHLLHLWATFKITTYNFY